MKNYLYTILPNIEGIYYEEAEESYSLRAVRKMKNYYSIYDSPYLPFGYQILPDRDKSIYYKIQKMLKLHYITCTNILDLSTKGVNHEFRVRKLYGTYIICGPDYHITIEPKGVKLDNYSAKILGYEYIILPDTFYNVLQRTMDILKELDEIWKTI